MFFFREFSFYVLAKFVFQTGIPQLVVDTVKFYVRINLEEGKSI